MESPEGSRSTEPHKSFLGLKESTEKKMTGHGGAGRDKSYVVSMCQHASAQPTGAEVKLSEGKYIFLAFLTLHNLQPIHMHTRIVFFFLGRTTHKGGKRRS